MRWIEIIKLQARVSREKEALVLLEHLAANVQNTPGLIEVTVYDSILVPNDFAIHLHWDTKPPMSQGSPLGMTLNHALEKFGLVDHSVWGKKE